MIRLLEIVVYLYLKKEEITIKLTGSLYDTLTEKLDEIADNLELNNITSIEEYYLGCYGDSVNVEIDNLESIKLYNTKKRKYRFILSKQPKVKLKSTLKIENCILDCNDVEIDIENPNMEYVMELDNVMLYNFKSTNIYCNKEQQCIKCKNNNILLSCRIEDYDNAIELHGNNNIIRQCNIRFNNVGVVNYNNDNCIYHNYFYNNNAHIYINMESLESYDIQSNQFYKNIAIYYVINKENYKKCVIANNFISGLCGLYFKNAQDILTDNKYHFPYCYNNQVFCNKEKIGVDMNNNAFINNLISHINNLIEEENLQ